MPILSRFCLVSILVLIGIAFLAIPISGSYPIRGIVGNSGEVFQGVAIAIPFGSLEGRGTLSMVSNEGMKCKGDFSYSDHGLAVIGSGTVHCSDNQRGAFVLMGGRSREGGCGQGAIGISPLTFTFGKRPGNAC